MKKHPPKPPKGSAVNPSEPRVPTRAQKREIMDLLEEVYDTDAEQYRRGDTDDTVADVLDVMPGWVAEIREEFFGPAGANEDMVKLRTDCVALQEAIEERRTAVDSVLADTDKLAERLAGLQNRLSGIEQAVGARTLAKVAK